MGKYSIEDVLSSRTNWNRWGPDDEIGTLNFLSNDQVLSAVRSVKKGRVFPLGLTVRGEGEPVSPRRKPPLIHLMTQDEGSYKSGRMKPYPGGLKFADDMVVMYLQGTTHIDAIGHAWHGNTIYNNYSADTTTGGLSKASIAPIARKGIVARGVLLDMAQFKGVDHLSKGEPVTLEDIRGAAKKQGVEVRKHDVLLLRTGYINVFYNEGEKAYFQDFNEPGIAFENDLAEWFRETEISAYGTDTIAGEQKHSSTVPGVDNPLHIVLLKFLGLPIQELLWLEDLARDCKEDGQYDFLYVCSPLRIAEGTASPINPLAIK